jgi:hypothetical protein
LVRPCAQPVLPLGLPDPGDDRRHDVGEVVMILRALGPRRNGRSVLVSEAPETATSATRRGVPPLRPPVPAKGDEYPNERGIVHEAGVRDGVQRRRRCGLLLPLPPGDGTFEVGDLIEHRRFSHGERMTSLVGRASSFPLLRRAVAASRSHTDRTCEGLSSPGGLVVRWVRRDRGLVQRD